MAKQIYIIGDVHGCYKTLLALIEKLPNKKKSKICFVGDLIDRGNSSRDVIKFVRKNNYDCVLGNHEYFMIDSLPKILKDNSKIATEKWTSKAGGVATLKSYDNEEEILNDLEYLKTLPLFLEYKNFKTKDGRYLVVSHSSVESKWKYKNYPKKSSEFEKLENSILHSRYKTHDNKGIFNVYGHTPTSEIVSNKFKAQIDLGCWYKRENPNAKLCALEFPSMKIYTQKNIE